MHTAICAFDDRHQAQEAIDSLQRAGFDRADLHMEHRQATSEGGVDAWDGEQREIHDRGVLSSFGHFFASLLGHDNPSGQADTYSKHVERGGCVVVVDAATEEEAQRARTLLRELRSGEVDVVQREGQPLRDILARGEPAGMMERSREAYEGWSPAESMARERAMAANRLDAIGGPKLREPDVGRAPGLRYADKDKPNG
ncbi:MAG TPA: hypothetical protein VEB23_06020 [Ramlibacter sp.]|nr:hypothetical protein [Ramlibacter sp.]